MIVQTTTKRMIGSGSDVWPMEAKRATGRQVQNGLACLVFLAAAFPVRLRVGMLGFGSFTIFDLIVLASLALLSVMLIATGRLQIGDRRTLLLLLVPAAAHLLSLLWSQNRGVTLYKGCFSVEAIAAYLMGVNVCWKMPSGQIMRYAGLLVVLLIAGAVLSFFHVPGFEPPIFGMDEGSADALAFLVSYYTRFSHPFIGLSNDFASVLAFFPLLFLAFGVAFRRRCFLFLAALTMAAILLTLSRGVLIGLSVSLAAFLFAVRGHIRLRLPLVGAGLALIALAGFGFLQVSELTQSNLQSRMSEQNIQDRQEKLQTALTMIKAAPVLGYGGGTSTDGNQDLQIGVHNTYVQQALSYGIPIGIIVSLAIAGLPFRFFFWASRKPGVRVVAMGIGGSLLAESLTFLSETSFEATLLRVLYYFSIGIGIALLRSLEQEEETHEFALGAAA